MPFSRIAELKQDANLNVLLDPSTREDHLLINHEHGALAKKEVRQALDMAIDEQAIVDTVTFGVGTVANSYHPGGRTATTMRQPEPAYDPEKAKELLEEAGASDLTLNYMVQAGNEVNEQTAVLVQQQLAQCRHHRQHQEDRSGRQLARPWSPATTTSRSTIGPTTSSTRTRRPPSCSATIPT